MNATPRPSFDAATAGARRATAAACLSHVYADCRNRGADRCQWPTEPGPCGFDGRPLEDAAPVLANRTVVFRGDSTLRELFSHTLRGCCPGATGVLKLQANWTYRTLSHRRNPATGADFWFQFDYTYEHLLESLSGLGGGDEPASGAGEPPGAAPRRVDVAVVSVGIYDARNLAQDDNVTEAAVARNATAVRRIADVVRRGVCERLGARVGFFVAPMLECRAMRRQKHARRKGAGTCSRSWVLLKLLNAALEREFAAWHRDADGFPATTVAPHVDALWRAVFDRDAKRRHAGRAPPVGDAAAPSAGDDPPPLTKRAGGDGGGGGQRPCSVFYLPHFQCAPPNWMCTSDGMHGRITTRFTHSRAQILLHALRTVLQPGSGFFDD